MRLGKKRLSLIIGIIGMLFASVLLLPAAAFASGGFSCGEAEQVDYVDIGDKDSEKGHRLRGWGPVEPDASGGNYGGIGDCRVTWEPGTPDKVWRRGASFRMKSPRGCQATRLVLNVLDGLADDSFVVYVGCRKVYSYEGDQNGTENWKEHEIDLSRRCSAGMLRRNITVRIIPTGPAWSGFDTYGQLAVDEATLFGKNCRIRCCRWRGW